MIKPDRQLPTSSTAMKSYALSAAPQSASKSASSCAKYALCCVVPSASRENTGKLSTTPATASMMGSFAGAGSARKNGSSWRAFARSAACLEADPPPGLQFAMGSRIVVRPRVLSSCQSSRLAGRAGW